uniref:Retrotransposon gag domain-containing protein n=1 Tax=Moniliophthora roreri TaxID=221103 RepID=A0A0W0FP06_MONRR
MSISGNFDSTNQQQSQFIPSGWVPSTEHPNPPAVSWTDLYSIYQTVSQLGATLGTMQQTQGATLQSLNAITAYLTQLRVLDEGPKGVPKFKKPNVFNGKALLVIQFLQDIRNAIQLSHCSLYNSIELNNKELLNDFGKFTESFKKHFGDSNIIATAQNKLDELYQTGSAAQYIARFNEWVVHLDLTDASKIHMLYCHLKASVKDAISFVPKFTHPTKFKDYCEFITGIDDHLYEHKLEKKKDRKPKDTRVDSPEPDPIPLSTSTTTSSLPTNSTLPLGTPMEIDAMKSKHHS